MINDTSVWLLSSVVCHFLVNTFLGIRNRQTETIWTLRDQKVGRTILVGLFSRAFYSVLATNK